MVSQTDGCETASATFQVVVSKFASPIENAGAMPLVHGRNGPYPAPTSLPLSNAVGQNGKWVNSAASLVRSIH